MFQLTTEGKTPTEIAEIFTAEKILIPRAYVAKTYGIYLTGYDTRYPYDWMGNTVASILRSKLYIGTLVNHKRTSKSFKNKKIVQLPEDEWIEVENTHDAIIDRETWDIALSRLSDDEYSRLSAQFSGERKETEGRLSAIAEELNKIVLNELIDKIEFHEAEKIDGKRVQKVDIYYRFVGNLT